MPRLPRKHLVTKLHNHRKKDTHNDVLAKISIYFRCLKIFQRHKSKESQGIAHLFRLPPLGEGGQGTACPKRSKCAFHIERERDQYIYIYIYCIYIVIYIYIYILIRERVQYMKDIKKGLIYHVVMQSA